ncbi:energy transducer TonB family protein [Undibacterium sp. Di24W]|uniref:energy transducer TonB family protein n=1 Tax=Undibacterium sp. Di24W TaxID=3413033 RepID=UPI003BF3B00F
MKTILDNLILSAAILVSVLFHTVVLLVHFVMPKPEETSATDPGLEIILVNAKHDKRPMNAQALAQVNLDGGGAHDEGRAKSPLPDMRRTEDGDSVLVAQRKVQELEERQRQLIDQVRNETRFKSQRVLDKKQLEDNQQQENGRDQVDSSKALARSIAEISQTIEDQNKRPRKTFLSPSTQAVGHAIYYKALQKKVEDVGTLNFPQVDGKKIYGEVIIYIPIFQDGTIYEKGGGPKVEKTSGNRVLDNAALKIVRKAAPFGNFPPNMRSKDKDDIWIVITRFKFTRDQVLETEMRGGAQ